METLFLGLIGFFMMYAFIHSSVLHWRGAYKDLTRYEKFLVIFNIICIGLHKLPQEHVPYKKNHRQTQ